MRRIAKECQDAMMSSSPREDSEVRFVDWCTELEAENVLWNEWGDKNLLPDGQPYLLTSQGASGETLLLRRRPIQRSKCLAAEATVGLA